MTFANPIIAAGLVGLAQLFADRAVTPVEACEAYLSRIAGLDGALGAYTFVDAEGARAAAHASAERWRRGEARSLLDGAPIAIKANVAVEGWPLTAGIAAYRERRAEADAAIVSRLREGGAVLLGLTNMHEGAFGAVTDNPHFGRTHNPWNFDLTAGGSSGGSGAATAAGLCAAAIGTDTLGSVRLPSAFCGIVGHRPQRGYLPGDGIVSMGWGLDVAGTHARSAADAARLFAGAIAGLEAELVEEIAEPAQADTLRAAPLGLLDLEGVPLAPSAGEALAQVVADARALGVEVEPVRLEGLDLPSLRKQALAVCAVESALEHAAALAHDPGGFSDAYLKVLETGAKRLAVDYARDKAELVQAAEEIREAFTPFAAVLAPASPLAPFPFDRPQPAETSEITALASVADMAATAFPMGLDDEGLPRSVQAIGWSDDVTLGLAAALMRDPGAPPAYRG